MRLLVDAQLPPALARWLTAQGHDAQHVFEVELGDSPDSVVWMHALKEAAVIVTKDEDFAVRAQLALVWPRIVEALDRGETLIEIA